MMNHKHTFAILAFGESVFLQECIDSLKKQDIRSQLLLCTSTPNAYLENISAQNNIPLIINPKKDGIAADWNFALNQATTEYVTLAHQDDIYFPSYTREILTAAHSRNDTLLVFSNYNEIVSSNQSSFIRKITLNFIIKKLILKIFFKNKNHICKHKKRLLALGSPIGCPTVSFQKNKIGNFKFDGNFSINMDWKAWFDLAQTEGSFIWINNCLASHRIHAKSETSRGIAENRRQSEDLVMFINFWPPLIAKMISKIYSLSYKNNN